MRKRKSLRFWECQGHLGDSRLDGCSFREHVRAFRSGSRRTRCSFAHRARTSAGTCARYEMASALPISIARRDRPRVVRKEGDAQKASVHSLFTLAALYLSLVRGSHWGAIRQPQPSPRPAEDRSGHSEDKGGQGLPLFLQHTGKALPSAERLFRDRLPCEANSQGGEDA